MDFKEYSRIRSIVSKRNKRLVEKGLSAPIHFPTVKEIKNHFVDPDVAFRFTRNYYESGAMLSEIKRYGTFDKSRTLIELIEKDKPKKKRRKKTNKTYTEESQKEFLRQHAENDLLAGRHESYVKAVKTMMENFRKHGRYLGIDLSTMSPQEVQDLAEYLDYRFSQGDFTKKYVIQDFVRDYSRIRAQGYTTDQIIKDFERFLVDRNKLRTASKKNKGVSSGTMSKYWKEFISVGISENVGEMGLTML